MCMLMYFLIAKKNKLWEKNKHWGKKKSKVSWLSPRNLNLRQAETEIARVVACQGK